MNSRRKALSWLAVVAAVAQLHGVTGATELGLADTTVLDHVQGLIGRSRAATPAEVEEAQSEFPQLVEAYLRSFAPLIADGAVFSPRDGEAWSERRMEMVLRIRQDLVAWHPIFAVTFAEALLALTDDDLHALMISPEGRSVRQARDDRIDELTREALAAGYPDSAAAEHAHKMFSKAGIRLRGAVALALEPWVTDFLTDALEVDPLSQRLNTIVRVTAILAGLARDWRYREIYERVLHGPGRGALPAALHSVVHAVLTRPGVESRRRAQHFGQALELWTELQNDASCDELLVLLVGFDEYDATVGDTAEVYDAILIQGVVGFVERSFDTDPERRLGLEVADQLTRWVVELVELEFPDLHHERIVDCLLAMREKPSGLLEQYITHFYRDFHALYPAGYETVIFHLTGILLDYAEVGVFVAQRTTGTAKPGATQRPAPERVLALLRWYDLTLAQVYKTLRSVEIAFVEGEQRRVLDRILDHLAGLLVGPRPDLTGRDYQFIGVLLDLLSRIAHIADPREIERRLMEPLTHKLQEEPVLTEKVADYYRDVLEQIRRAQQRF